MNIIKEIPNSAIVGKDCGITAGHYLARRKGWGFRCELYCDGVNWFFADHNFGNPDSPKLSPLKDDIELIDIEINNWNPIHFSFEKENEVPFNQIDWYSKDCISEIKQQEKFKRSLGFGLPTMAEFEQIIKGNQDESK